MKKLESINLNLFSNLYFLYFLVKNDDFEICMTSMEFGIRDHYHLVGSLCSWNKLPAIKIFLFKNNDPPGKPLGYFPWNRKKFLSYAKIATVEFFLSFFEIFFERYETHNACTFFYYKKSITMQVQYLDHDAFCVFSIYLWCWHAVVLEYNVIRH